VVFDHRAQRLGNEGAQMVSGQALDYVEEGRSKIRRQFPLFYAVGIFRDKSFGENETVRLNEPQPS
jgi:hypothetical protein